MNGDRTSRQPDEQDRLEARVREKLKLVRQFDSSLEDLADYFRQNLPDHTRHLLHAIPQQMDTWRQEALDKYRYDLATQRWASNSEEAVKSAEDALGLVTLLTHYSTYRGVMELWKSYVQLGLSGRLLQMAVCQSVIEAYRLRPGLAAQGIQTFETGLPDFAQGLALSVYLTAHVAARTSLHKNLRLRAGIGERRVDDETLFSRLLKELPAEVLAAYRERSAGWGDLMDVRTVAARRLEKTSSQSRSETEELATFVDREVLLTHAKAARLSPQEFELFQLCIDKPKLAYREIAAELGISVSQVGVVKHRIKNKLIA